MFNITLIIIVILGCIGCSLIKNKFEIGKKSDVEISQNDVLLSLKEGSLSNTGVTVIIKNNSDKFLYFDEEYEIEIKQDDDWYKINAVLDFTEPLWELAPSESKELKVFWKNGYGKLASGQYRIIKKVFLKGEDQTIKFNVSIEFNIK